MLRLLVFSAMLSITAAQAHGPEKKPDYGWRAPVSSSGSAKPAANAAIKMDLIVEGQIIKLFITDSEGEPVAIDIAEAKAYISSAGKTSWLSLRPAGMNILSGEGDFVADSEMRVDITLRLPGRRPINKDFRPLQ